jgi:hypothetical protein
MDLITFVASDEDSKRFLKLRHDITDEAFSKQNKTNISEMTLLQTLEYGIGFLHDGMSEKEIKYIKKIYN